MPTSVGGREVGPVGFGMLGKSSVMYLVLFPVTEDKTSSIEST